MDRRTFLKQGLGSLTALGLAGTLLTGGVAAGARNWGENDLLAGWRERQPTPPVDELDLNVFAFSRLRFITRTSAVVNEWDAYPFADENVLAMLRNVTNIKVSSRSFEERVVSIDDFEKMRRSPFLFMTSDGEFTFNGEEAAALGEFFKRGGFLYADDCYDAELVDAFYRSFLREIQKAIPGHEMQPVPQDHEIYRCFFEFPGQAPFVQGRRNPDMGLFWKKRLVAFLTSGDLHCAWSGLTRNWPLEEQCMKMGVNIITYALTH